jgi:hypothetical protein
MCVGGCLALSALIFAVRIVLSHSSVVSLKTLTWLQSLAVPCLAPSDTTDLVIFIVSVVLAGCLICLGRIKGMQEMQILSINR